MESDYARQAAQDAVHLVFGTEPKVRTSKPLHAEEWTTVFMRFGCPRIEIRQARESAEALERLKETFRVVAEHSARTLHHTTFAPLADYELQESPEDSVADGGPVEPLGDVYTFEVAIRYRARSLTQAG